MKTANNKNVKRKHLTNDLIKINNINISTNPYNIHINTDKTGYFPDKKQFSQTYYYYGNFNQIFLA